MSDNRNEKQIAESVLQTGRKMSSALKKKLQHNARSFSSPISMPTCSFSQEAKIEAEKKSFTDIYTGPEISVENIEICEDQETLKKMYLKLKHDVSVKEEKLRKLTLVEKHTVKNKPDELEQSIFKWLNAAQQGLRRLYEKLPENKGSFQDMLCMLNIDSDAIHYVPETDSFF